MYGKVNLYVHYKAALSKILNKMHTVFWLPLAFGEY